MEIVTLLIHQNIIMVVYMACGYFLYKKKIITKAGSGDLGKMLLYLVMPMAIIKSYIREFSVDLLLSFLISFGISLMALILAILISKYLCCKTVWKCIFQCRLYWNSSCTDGLR